MCFLALIANSTKLGKRAFFIGVNLHGKLTLSLGKAYPKPTLPTLRPLKRITIEPIVFLCLVMVKPTRFPKPYWSSHARFYKPCNLISSIPKHRFIIQPISSPPSQTLPA